MAETRIAEPDPGGFSHPVQAFVDKNDIYIVDFKLNEGTSLWRLRNSKWQLVTPCLRPIFALHPNWENTPLGLFISSPQMPPHLIRTDGEIFTLDWRTNFFGGFPRKIFLLPDQSLLLIDDNNSPRQVAYSPPETPVHSSRITQFEIPTDDSWSVDRDGNLWILSLLPEKMIKKWDGSTWRNTPLPREIQRECTRGIFWDEFDRLWIYPSDTSKCMAYYNPRSEKWTTYSNIKTAFESVKNTPPRFPQYDLNLPAPVYSKDHTRIAFRESDSIQYFNGQKWLDYSDKKITSDISHNSCVGFPWFDKDDKLNVKAGGSSWVLDGNERWRKSELSKQNGALDDESKDISKHWKPAPEGWPSECLEKYVFDNSGVCWFTYEKKLYKAINYCSARVFDDSEPTPFQAGESLGGRSVFVDKMGNAFVYTGYRAGHLYLIRAKLPPPQTKLEMSVLSEDSVEVRLQSNSPEIMSYRWKLDNEDWKQTKESTLTFRHLQNGGHQVLVEAVDNELKIETPPSKILFQTSIDEQKLLLVLIEELLGENVPKRVEAIKVLTRISATALPALKKARETADDDQRWRIDAAIQEICGKNKPRPSDAFDQKVK